MFYFVIGFFIVGPIIALVLFAFLRYQKYPEKNFKNALIQTALTPLRKFKIGPYKHGDLTLDKSLKYAMKKAQLTDFGNMDFVSNYRIVMDGDHYKSQKFTNIGYLAASIELNITWVRRLKFLDYIKKNPQILNVPVPSPVFVMGLPRTGTTFMHRLLSLDPRIRAPLLWELINPVPTVSPSASAADKTKDLEKRKLKIKALINQRKEMGDHALEHIHEIGYDLPEECLMGLTDEVPVNIQFLFSAYMTAEKFLTIDGVDAYKHYRKMLQLLSHQIGEDSSPRRWMLKCPIHLFYTKAIAAAFPDAKLIWTHRHPISAVPSLCSLLKATHQIYFEKEGRDDSELGRNLCRVTANLLEQAPKDIEESGLPCFHLTYESLVADPVGQVKAIYSHYGWEFTAEYEKILKDYLEENARQRKAKAKGAAALHTYHPSEFGLTDNDLTQGKYAKYVEKFNVPMSRN